MHKIKNISSNEIIGIRSAHHLVSITVGINQFAFAVNGNSKWKMFYKVLIFFVGLAMSLFELLSFGDVANDTVTHHNAVGHPRGDTVGFDPDHLPAPVEASFPLPGLQVSKASFGALVKDIPVFVIDEVLHGHNATQENLLADAKDLFAFRTDVREVAGAVGKDGVFENYSGQVIEHVHKIASMRQTDCITHGLGSKKKQDNSFVAFA
jgi:hypothetical protein